MSIYDLPDEDRRIALGIIRGLLVKTGVARTEGLERAEELAVRLIDSGLMFVCFNEQMTRCWFELTPEGQRWWGLRQ